MDCLKYYFNIINSGKIWIKFSELITLLKVADSMETMFFYDLINISIYLIRTKITTRQYNAEVFQWLILEG